MDQTPHRDINSLCRHKAIAELDSSLKDMCGVCASELIYKLVISADGIRMALVIH